MDIRSIILISEDKQTNKEYMAVRETYISRILSALSDGVAKVDEKIKEVISIWICIDARKNEDSIIEYQLRPEVKFGENIHPEEINLLKGILIKIRAGKNMTQSKNKLIEMLEYVIADHSAEEKKNYLKNECSSSVSFANLPVENLNINIKKATFSSLSYILLQYILFLIFFLLVFQKK